MPLDDELLAEYITTFYGYGNYRGEWWLVGMEEGGGDSVNDITSRLTRWNGRGRKELEDVDLFVGSPSHEKWFTRSPLRHALNTFNSGSWSISRRRSFSTAVAPNTGSVGRRWLELRSKQRNWLAWTL